MNFLEQVKQAEKNILAKLERSGFETSNDLQRTDKWFEQRRGRFTGSEIHKLMSCSRSTAKLEWGRAEKIIDLGEVAKKYIYSKAKERQRSKVIRLPSTATMKYGTENESIVVEILKEKHGYDVEQCGFIEFIKDIAGASPDGRISANIGLEIKCSTNWDTLYDRHEIVFDKKNKDFWQIQSEMLALKVDKMLYVVAEPSESIFEPNITDVSIKTVEASEIHQVAIKQRCMLGDMIIKKYLSGVDFQEAVLWGCGEFEI